MAIPWGAIIGAGAGLVGKLFGGGDDKKESSRVNYKQMVRDAEAAGFNPLTVLRAGGAAGYTQTSHPALSSYNPLGAVAEAIGTVAMNYDGEADRRRAAEYDLLQAQLGNIQADTRLKMRSLEVPVRSGSQAVDQTGRPIKSASGDLGLPGSISVGDLSVTNPFGAGSVNPAVPDGQHWGDRYGEPGEWLGGAYVMAQDAAYNLKAAAPLGTSKSFTERAHDVWNSPVSYMKSFNDWVEADLAKGVHW